MKRETGRQEVHEQQNFRLLPPERFTGKTESEVAARLFAEASRFYSASAIAQGAYILREHRRAQLQTPLGELLEAVEHDGRQRTRLTDAANAAHEVSGKDVGYIPESLLMQVLRKSFERAEDVSELEFEDLDVVMGPLFAKYRQLPLIEGGTSDREGQYWREVQAILLKRRMKNRLQALRAKLSRIW